MRENWMIQYSESVPVRFASRAWGKLRPFFMLDYVVSVAEIMENGDLRHVATVRQYFRDHAQRIFVPVDKPNPDPNYCVMYVHSYIEGQDVQLTGRVLIDALNKQINRIVDDIENENRYGNRYGMLCR